MRAEQAAQLRPAPISGIKRTPIPEAKPKKPTGGGSSGSGGGQAPSPVAVAEEGQAEAPVAPPSQEEAAPAPVAPSVPFHNETLTLPERMKMAEELGGTLELKLFASMAQTDCAACGWDCEGYAHALATDETKDISLCTPGELETLDSLKALMQAAGKEFEGA